MKFKITIAAVLVAALTASLAVAAPAKTSKKPTGTTTTSTTPVKKTHKKVVCRPNVALILRGDLVSVNEAEQYFTMNVKGTNRHAKAYKGVADQRVDVNAKTKIKRLGKRVTLGELKIGDRLNVQARVCKVKKGTVVVAPAPPLAKRVIAKPAKPAPTTTTTS
jgi:hypothetical protein